MSVKLDISLVSSFSGGKNIFRDLRPNLDSNDALGACVGKADKPPTFESFKYSCASFLSQFNQVCQFRLGREAGPQFAGFEFPLKII